LARLLPGRSPPGHANATRDGAALDAASSRLVMPFCHQVRCQKGRLPACRLRLPSQV
jgi:hypothetical protein